MHGEGRWGTAAQYADGRPRERQTGRIARHRLYCLMTRRGASPRAGRPIRRGNTGWEHQQERWAADERHATLVPARAEQCASVQSEHAALSLDDVRVRESTRAACIGAV